MLALKNKSPQLFFFNLFVTENDNVIFIWLFNSKTCFYFFEKQTHTHKGERKKSKHITTSYEFGFESLIHNIYIYIYCLFVCILSSGCKKRFSDVFYDVKWKRFLISQPNLPLCKTHRVGANPIGFTQKHIKLD